MFKKQKNKIFLFISNYWGFFSTFQSNRGVNHSKAFYHHTRQKNMDSALSTIATIKTLSWIYRNPITTMGLGAICLGSGTVFILKAVDLVIMHKEIVAYVESIATRVAENSERLVSNAEAYETITNAMGISW